MMNHFLIRFALLLTLLPTVTLANPYDVDYFIQNPADIKDQLEICRIQVWNAKVSGNLANVKAAKNNPACVAANQAQAQIKNSKEAKAENEYALRKKARANMKIEVEKLAQQNTMKALKAKEASCDNKPHPVLGRGGSVCSKLSQAIYKREKLDEEDAIASYRSKNGKMGEKERFVLLAEMGACRKAYDRKTCQNIRRAQSLDEQAYRKVFTENHKAAQNMVAKCKIPFFKELAIVKAIANAGDRMRAESALINLYKPPFDNPLACKTAASALGTAFGMMAYE